MCGRSSPGSLVGPSPPSAGRDGGGGRVRGAAEAAAPLGVECDEVGR